MASPWPELPLTVLTQIIGLLEVSDVVKLAKVCENWRQVAVESLKSVKIDESLPFRGLWTNSNYCNWPKLSKTPFAEPNVIGLIKSIADVATSLAEITDQIEHLYFNGSFIPARALKVLLSSQKAIKTLHVKKRQFETRLTDIYTDTHLNIPGEVKLEEITQAVAEGVIRHEVTLEDINIWIEDEMNVENYSEKDGESLRKRSPEQEEEFRFTTNEPMLFHRLLQLLGKREKYFPNLKSVSLVSAIFLLHTPWDFDITGRSLSEEEICIQKVFERILQDHVIRKLEVAPNVDVGGVNFGNTFCMSLWKPYFSLPNLIKSGSLRVINFDIFGLEDLLIKYCPNITHIDCWYLSYHPEYNEQDFRGLLKMIKHYGPKLIGINCYNMNEKIAMHIAQHCCNLESLRFIDDGSKLILSKLKKLKKLTMGDIEDPSSVEKDIGTLTELELECQWSLNPKLLDVIRQGAKSLQSLKIEFRPETFEDFVGIMDGFIKLLEEFHCLEKLCVQAQADDWYSYDRDFEEENNWRGHDKITELLLKNQSKLKRLHLNLKLFMSKENEEMLIEGMPKCKITFHNFDHSGG